ERPGPGCPDRYGWRAGLGGGTAGCGRITGPDRTVRRFSDSDRDPRRRRRRGGRRPGARVGRHERPCAVASVSYTEASPRPQRRGLAPVVAAWPRRSVAAATLDVWLLPSIADTGPRPSPN